MSQLNQCAILDRAAHGKEGNSQFETICERLKCFQFYLHIFFVSAVFTPHHQLVFI